MAISKIASAGVATDTLTAADLAPDSVGASEIAASAVGISELSSVTGITADYHKVPTFANDSARDAAIGSPTVGMLVYNTASGHQGKFFLLMMVLLLQPVQKYVYLHKEASGLLPCL